MNCGRNSTTSFNKWLFHYILCIFSYGFELQLGGAVEISPRALVVLKPPLVHSNYFFKSILILIIDTVQKTGYIPAVTLANVLDLTEEKHHKVFASMTSILQLATYYITAFLIITSFKV